MLTELYHFPGKKIAPVFQLQASTIYLVREFENLAVFPHEMSGRFNRSLIDASAVYAVHGEECGSPTPQAPASSVQSPIGAYTGPSSFHSTVPTAALTKATNRKPNCFRKTVALVSLTDDNKPSTSKAINLEYKIITQLVISIEFGHCSLVAVADSVSQQVGFPVVLLDSKCYRIMDSTTTNSIGFWKSNHKVLAASLAMYEKLKGTISPLQDAVDLTNDDDEPTSKRPRLSGSYDSKLDNILEGVDYLQKKERSALLKCLANTFECVVCKSTMTKPLFASCCCRAIGCQSCVNRWIDERGCCPHCSSASTRCFEVKGIDELFTSVHHLCCDALVTTDKAPNVTSPGSDSDSDFELPRVSIRRRM